MIVFNYPIRQSRIYYLRGRNRRLVFGDKISNTVLIIWHVPYGLDNRQHLLDVELHWVTNSDYTTTIGDILIVNGEII